MAVALTPTRTEPSEPVETAPLRAAALVRLSRMTDQTTSPQRQSEDIAKHIDAAGWTFDPDQDRYEDLDRSGWKPGVRREGLEALVANLDRYDVVVFWKLDRAFRSMTGFLRFLEQCEAHNVGLVSVKEAAMDTTSPWGRFLAYVLMAIAEIESSNTSLRSRSAQEYLRTNGYWAGGAAPYGWKLTPAPGGHHRLALDPTRAKALRTTIDKVLAGESLDATTRWLSEHGPARATNKNGTTRAGHGWTSTGLRRLLRNPVLLGHSTYKGQSLLTPEGVPLVAHDALIDYWTWTRLQAAIDKLGAGSSNQRRHDEALLKSLVRCGHCDRAMPAGPKAYACPTRRSAPTRCPGNSMGRAPLEAYVVAAVLARLNPERLAEADRLLQLERQALTGPSPEALRRQELTAALDRLEDDRQAGLYDSDAATARYRAQHHKLTTELDALAAPTGPDHLDLAPLAELAATGADEEDLAERWATLTRTQQRTLLGAVAQRITINLRPEGTRKRFDTRRIAITWADEAQ